MLDLLTSSDLVRLTGYQSAAHQVRWLANNKIPHRVRCDGTPVTTVTAVNQALAADLASGSRQSGSGPRLDLVRKTGS